MHSPATIGEHNNREVLLQDIAIKMDEYKDYYTDQEKVREAAKQKSIESTDEVTPVNDLGYDKDSAS